MLAALDTGHRPRDHYCPVASTDVGLTVPETTSTARASPSHATTTAVRPSTPTACGPGQVVTRPDAPLARQPLPPDDQRAAVDHAPHAQALRVLDAFDLGRVDRRTRSPLPHRGRRS